MNESDEETCITFHLSNRNMCNNCISWEDRRLSRPGKKRDSLCRKPWMLRDNANIDNLQHRTIRKICGSWDDMIRTGIFKNDDIPPSVRIAASTIRHKFVTTSVKSEKEESGTKPILQSQRSRRRSGATRKEAIPPPRYTPKDRKKKKITQVGGANTNIYNDNASSSQFEMPGIASFNNLVNNLEGRFHSTLNLLENACGNVNNVADESNTTASSTNTPARYNSLVSVDTIQNLNVVIPPTSRTNCFDQREKEFLNKNNKLLQSQLNEVKKNHRLEKKKLEDEIGNLKKENLFLDKHVSNLDNQLKTIKHNELSCYDRLINKSYYTVLHQFKDDVTKLMKQVKAGRYIGKSNLGKRLLGEVLATHPSISFVNAAEIIMISRAQLLTEADWVVDGNKLSLNDIGLSSPSDKYLRDILDDTASDVLFLMFFKIFYEDKVGETVPSLYLSCDKATNGGFVKILSWYSPTSNKVEQKIFDVDKTYGDSIECAKAM